MDVAKRIKLIIVEKGLYQRFVAEKVGFTEQQFSDMLNGRKIIRAEHIPAIAKALGVDFNELFATDRVEL